MSTPSGVIKESIIEKTYSSEISANPMLFT